MIPEFPEFKNIELSDKQETETFTKQFLPYSDYVFLSMFSWDFNGAMQFSSLNENLVVRFTDYLTGKPFFSFIGKNKVDETVDALLDFAKSENYETGIKLIPEETAALIDPQKFSVTEDRNSFDYIYATEEHRTFSGGSFSGKRNEISSLLKSHPTIRAVEIDICDAQNKDKMIALYRKWAEGKLANKKDFEEHEELAFQRLLNLIKLNFEHLKGVGVYHENELLAFCIYEIVNPLYAVGHTAKSDVSIKGTNAFLMRSLSEILANQGIQYFNYEQDLGLENLRISKERYRPSFFLKKYTVKRVELSTGYSIF